MAKYSSVADTPEPTWKAMGEDYHAKGEDWVTNMLVAQSGWDAASITATGFSWKTKQISILRAKELYAQDSSKQEGDQWDALRKQVLSERIHLESTWVPERDLVSSNINSTRQQAGISSRIFRT